MRVMREECLHCCSLLSPPQANLLTSAQCVPTYKGIPLRTSLGELKATSLASATIR